MHPVHRFAVLCGAAALLANMAACAPARDSRGYVLNERAVGALTPGKDTRDTVLTALGTPSAVGTFHADSWYYVSIQTESVPYRMPKVLDQQVVAIDFTERGVVADIRRYTMADATAVNPVDRETPTRGREMSFMEQLVGNIGKFNNGAPQPIGR